MTSSRVSSVFAPLFHLTPHLAFHRLVRIVSKGFSVLSNIYSQSSQELNPTLSFRKSCRQVFERKSEGEACGAGPYQAQPMFLARRRAAPVWKNAPFPLSFRLKMCHIKLPRLRPLCTVPENNTAHVRTDRVQHGRTNHCLDVVADAM